MAHRKTKSSITEVPTTPGHYKTGSQTKYKHKRKMKYSE